MPAGSWNIIFGLIAIAAGASGRFHLIGTQSPMALIVLGAAITLFGLYQFIRSKRA